MKPKSDLQEALDEISSPAGQKALRDEFPEHYGPKPETLGSLLMKLIGYGGAALIFYRYFTGQ